MDENSKFVFKGFVVGDTSDNTYPQVVLWKHVEVNRCFDEKGLLKDGFSIEPDYDGEKIVGYSIVPKEELK